MQVGGSTASAACRGVEQREQQCNTAPKAPTCGGGPPERLEIKSLFSHACYINYCGVLLDLFLTCSHLADLFYPKPVVGSLR